MPQVPAPPALTRGRRSRRLGLCRLASLGGLLALALAVAAPAQATPFLTSFDNAYLTTDALPPPGADVLDAPPSSAAEIEGDLNLATGAFTGGGLNSELVTSQFGEAKITIDFDSTEPITGTIDAATGQVISNPSAYRAKMILDPTPAPLDETTCMIGDEPGGEDTPDLVLAFSTEAGYPSSPYDGDRFSSDVPNLATHALNDGAVVATWPSVPAPIYESGPGDCEFAETLTQGSGALWMADGLTGPTLATPPPVESPPPVGSSPSPESFAGLAPPVYGRSVNVEPVSGTVLVKPRGQRRFQRLTSATTIAVGSRLNTIKGRVRLTSAKNRAGAAETADFYQGRFQVRQPKKGKPITELKLEGSRPSGCTHKASASKRSRSRGAGLWGNGKGNYRTRGKYGAATVRGTVWKVAELCGGTLFKVRRGVVKVRDFARRRTVTLKAGGSYLASPR